MPNSMPHAALARVSLAQPGLKDSIWVMFEHKRDGDATIALSVDTVVISM